ncbi:MAG: hypothetical protein ACYTGZ_21420 [Planctomycetota bacterium]
MHVDCDECGNPFDVDDKLAGGITNCPRCGNATTVPGLRDAWFRVVQIVLAVLWALLTAVAYAAGGPTVAFLVGGACVLLFAFLYICL